MSLLNKQLESYVIGQSNAVFVFGKNESSRSVITKVIATIVDQPNKNRIQFNSVPYFENKTRKHIFSNVLPVVDTIAATLGLSKKSYQLAIVNLDLSSILDTSFSVSGFSADLPVFIALLSAALQIPVPIDFISTGHIASPYGDIRMVKEIPSKLNSAIKNKKIKSFIYPRIDQDDSLESLSPKKKLIVLDALTMAKKSINIYAVKNIHELIKKVFPEELVIFGSLEQSYCNTHIPKDLSNTSIGRTILFFSGRIFDRFWMIIESYLMTGKIHNAKELLSVFISYHIKHEIYPKGFGKRLRNIVYSIPPKTIRCKIDFPIITISQFIALGQFAKEVDLEDLQTLNSINIDKSLHLTPQKYNPKSPKQHNKNANKSVVQSIVSEINAEALSKIFGNPIDSARAKYLLESIKIDNHDDFAKTITSFYVHLIRHTQKIIDFSSKDYFDAEAFSLIDRTFSNRGGYRWALTEAKHGINGGMRMILDMMTEQFKQEEQKKYVNYIIKLSIDPLDFDKKVSLIKEIILTLQHVLPDEIKIQPPEKFAVHYEIIVNAYVESINEVKAIFRNF